MYISPTPVSSLPPPVGGIDPPNPEVFSQIKFMYIPKWQDLLTQLFLIHTQHNPATIIIVENLSFYCDDGTEDNASLICATLLNAAAVCSKKVNKPSVLIADYPSDGTVHTIIKNFFRNMWRLECEHDTNDKECVKVTNLLDFPQSDKGAVFLFSVDRSAESTFLTLQSVYKRVFRLDLSIGIPHDHEPT